LFSDLASSQETERVWTSADGREKIRAVLIDYQPRERLATLRLTNGKTIDLSTRKLSAKDRHHLRSFLTNKNDEAANLTPTATTASEAIKKSESRSQRSPRAGRMQKLYGIDWVTDIPAALAQAEGSESANDDRPVMWFRVLGDLSGFM
jgi:hypothetical protein